MQQRNMNRVFCSRCGTQNSTLGSFCINCGNELNNSANATQGYNPMHQINNYKLSNEMSLFVEKNQFYYQEKFNMINLTGDKKSWNWCAFLFNSAWMAYRKMYKQAAGVYIVSLILSFIPYIGPLANFAFLVAVGIYSNSLYLDHINKNLQEIEQLYPDHKELMIMKKGGTSVPAMIVIIIISIIQSSIALSML